MWPWTRLEQKLDALTRKVTQMHDELLAYADRIDKATNAIATEIQQLLADQPLPQAIKDRFDTVVANLEALGKNPTP